MDMSTRMETVKKRIDTLLAQKDFLVVAIDGKCTSGKTTLAAQLAKEYDCNVFHMDDFFLRPEQRTTRRYEEVGGNVDYERFRETVLLPLLSRKGFTYFSFDCKNLTLSEAVHVTAKPLNIIEGSYSLHPYFGDPYDLKILLTVDPELQRQRIMQRPEHLRKRFFEEWIPMENRYLEHLSRQNIFTPE